MKSPADLLHPATIAHVRGLPGKAGLSLLTEASELLAQIMPGELRQLRKLAARRDATGFSSAAHSLAGGASAVGAQRMRQVLDEAEQAAKVDDWEETRRALVRLSATWSKTRLALARETGPDRPPKAGVPKR